MRKEYASYNHYGYRNLTIIIDTDKKHVALYHGCTAPISKPDKKTSSKFIREQFETLTAAGFTSEVFYTRGLYYE